MLRYTLTLKAARFNSCFVLSSTNLFHQQNLQLLSPGFIFIGKDIVKQLGLGLDLGLGWE